MTSLENALFTGLRGMIMELSEVDLHTLEAYKVGYADGRIPGKWLLNAYVAGLEGSPSFAWIRVQNRLTVWLGNHCYRKILEGK